MSNPRLICGAVPLWNLDSPLFSLVRPEAASPRATLNESASGQAVTDLLNQTPAELQQQRRSWAVPHRLPRRAALPRRRVRQCDKLSPWVSAMTFPFSSHRRAHLLGYARACQAVQNLYELCRRWLESQRPIHQQAVWIAGSEANNSGRTIPVMCRTDNCSNCRLLHYPERKAAQTQETPPSEEASDGWWLPSRMPCRTTRLSQDLNLNCTTHGQI